MGADSSGLVRKGPLRMLVIAAVLLLFCGRAVAEPLEEARRFFLIGDWRKAVTAYEAASGGDLPSSVLSAYAEACFRSGDYKKTEKVLATLQKQGENLPATVLLLLVMAREGGRTGAVEKLEALSNKPGHSMAEEALVLTALGELLRPVSTEKALFYSKKAVEKDPDSYWAWFVLGTIYEEDELFGDAAKAYMRAIRVNPLSALAHNNLGYSYKERHFYRYAIDEYKKAIDLMPDQPGFYYNIGNAFTHEELIDEAFHAYKKAVELDPAFAKAHYNVARTYLRKDMVQPAIDSFRLYLEYGTKAVFAAVASQRAVEEEIEQLEQYLQGHPSMKYPKGQVAR